MHAVAPGATIAELLIDPAALADPAEAANEFTTLVRLASREGNVISLSVSFGEHFLSAEQVAAVHSALEFAVNRYVTVIGASGDDGVVGYHAGPGWDPDTGWGSPNAQILIPLLTTTSP